MAKTRKKTDQMKTGSTSYCSDKNPMVGIAGSIGGISIAIVAIFAIFMKEQAWVLVPIIISLAVMGIFLGLFAMKRR